MVFYWNVYKQKLQGSSFFCLKDFSVLMYLLTLYRYWCIYWNSRWIGRISGNSVVNFMLGSSTERPINEALQESSFFDLKDLSLALCWCIYWHSTDTDVSTDTLVELAELVLKNNIFNFSEEILKQKRGTGIGTKFVLPFSILFMAESEETILEKVDNKPYLWWRYIDDIFFIWVYGGKIKELCRNHQWY